MELLVTGGIVAGGAVLTWLYSAGVSADVRELQARRGSQCCTDDYCTAARCAPPRLTPLQGAKMVDPAHAHAEARGGDAFVALYGQVRPLNPNQALSTVTLERPLQGVVRRWHSCKGPMCRRSCRPRSRSTAACGASTRARGPPAGLPAALTARRYDEVKHVTSVERDVPFGVAGGSTFGPPGAAPG